MDTRDNPFPGDALSIVLGVAKYLLDEGEGGPGCCGFMDGTAGQPGQVPQMDRSHITYGAFPLCSARIYVVMGKYDTDPVCTTEP